MKKKREKSADTGLGKKRADFLIKGLCKCRVRTVAFPMGQTDLAGTDYETDFCETVKRLP